MPKALTVTRLLLASLVWIIGTAAQPIVAQEAPFTFTDFLDEGLAAAYETGEITPLGMSESVGSYTVTLDWAYADANRISVAYHVIGQPDVEYTNLSAAPSLTVTENDGTPIIGRVGMTSSFIDPETGSSLGLTTGSFDAQPGTVLTVEMNLGVEAVTAERRTAVPDMNRFNEIIERSDPVSFTFEVPVSGTLRESSESQTETDQDIALTLDAFRVSPTRVRLTLCFVEPEADRSWTSIPFVLVDGDELVPNGGTITYLAGARDAAYRTRADESEMAATLEATADPSIPAQTCDDHSYIAATNRYADITEWTVEVRELVGFGSSGGDQHRIAGEWTFAVELP